MKIRLHLIVNLSAAVSSNIALSPLVHDDLGPESISGSTRRREIHKAIMIRFDLPSSPPVCQREFTITPFKPRHEQRKYIPTKSLTPRDRRHGATPDAMLSPRSILFGCIREERLWRHPEPSSACVWQALIPMVPAASCGERALPFRSLAREEKRAGRPK